MKNNKKVLAFDIGGTKIASGIIEFEKDSYKIIDYQKNTTPKDKDGVIQMLIELIVYYQKDNGFDKIDVATLGRVDSKKGIVIRAGNIKGWENVKLKKIIEKATCKNVEIDNDVKCFALAENRFGKFRRYNNVVYLTIGTGIGGAIEVDNKLYRGNNNITGEFGHMVVVNNGKKCPCGSQGCWQQYASGKAIEKLYFELYKQKKKAKDIAIDSANGVQKDKKVIKRSASYLATGLINIINTINPEIIVIGGSVVKQKEILDLARKDVLKKALIPARKTKIVKSNLGDEAMLVGAALL
ncbi:MAG: ROK family protein [Candidatus Pacebacteria bacterium]|nr:ROK family protein [Candidatus Paceibacterota bacterium]